MSVNEPKRWPLVTSLAPRAPGRLPPFDPGLVNCFAEYNQQEQMWTIEKRPGLQLQTRYSTTYKLGLGMTEFQGGLVVASAQAIGDVISNSQTFVGTVGTATGFLGYGVRFIETSPDQLLYGNGQQTAYVLNAGSSVPTDLGSLSVGAFPPTGTPLCQGFANLDGTTYVMDIDGNIFGSAIQDVTSWDPLNVIQANEKPDSGVYLTKYLGLYVAAFKSSSVQFFYDTGNPTGSPLTPLKGSSLPIGCLNANTVQAIDDSVIIWVAADESEQPKVAMLNNMNLSIVSDPSIEKILFASAFSPQIYSAANAVISFQFKFRGHRWYLLTMRDIGITIVYDIDQKLWYYWPWPLVSIVGLSALSSINGVTYNVNGCEIFPNDDTANDIPVDIYTPNFDDGTSLGKYLSAMKFVADRLPTTMQVRCNDYDYDPTKWTNYRSVNMNLQQPALIDCGTFQRRAYNFHHDDNTAFRIRAVDLQMDRCSI